MPQEIVSHPTFKMVLRSIVKQLQITLMLCLFAAPVISAQQKPSNCDSGCGGSGPTDGLAVIAARGSVTASRGMGTKQTRGHLVAKAVAVQGSNSFSYAVPLFALPGRGLNLNLTLYYNSLVWTQGGIHGNWMILNADQDTPSYGFRLDFGWLNFGANSDGTLVGVLTEANGSKHPIGVSPSGQSVTTDSSNILLQNMGGGSGWIATYKDGTRITYTPINPAGFALAYRPTQIEDTNGNVIAIKYLNTTNVLVSSITDTVGRTINLFYDSTGTMLSCVTTGSACNSPGAKTYAFNWMNPSYVLNFTFSKSAGTTLQSGVTTLNVLTGITRPDKTSVTFGYGDWAIVNKIQELSATGQIRYSTSFNFPLASAGPLQFNPTYTQQTVFDGVHTSTWNFQSTVQATTGLVTAMAITDPLGTTSATTFSSKGDWEDGLPIEELICGPGSQPFCQSGTGTSILRTTNKSWTSDGVTSFNPKAASVTTILEDGQTQSQTVFNAYDANGNLTDLLEYDFGSGTHGALLREIVTSFATLANNILNRPSDVQVKDAHSNVLSHRKFSYDETTPTNVTANLPGRDPNFAATVRGNLTSAVEYANAAAGTGAITSTFTYDSTGNLLSAQAGCCTFSQRNFSSTTQYAFPDSVATGPTGSQMTTNFTYNMATGTVATTTDPNGQTVTFNYDIDNRPTTTQTPDGVTVTNVYDDNSGFPSVTTSNSSNSLVTETTTDGRGRALTKQALNGTAPVSTQSFIYDSVGRLSQASNPYGSDTPVYSTYQYDALGRVTSTTPPAQSTGTGQNSYSTSYSLATVTVTDPVGKQRKEYGDALGRLLRVDEPGLINGSAASATTTISGLEQTVATTSGNGASAGTASVTIAGSGPAGYTFCSMENQTCSFSGTMNVAFGANGTFIFHNGVTGSVACNDATFTDPAIGTVKACYINSSTGPLDRSQPVLTNAATSASLTVTIGGTDGTNSLITQTCTGGPPSRLPLTCHTVAHGTADTGSIQFSVSAGGTTIGPVSATYGAGSTAISLAAALFKNFPTANSLVTMSNPNGSASFTLTTTSTGSAANSTTLSTQIIDNCQASTTEICSEGWAISSGQSNFSGGSDNVFTTIYDAGTVTVSATVSGNSYSKKSIYGQNSTSASIANDLSNQINSDPTLNKLIVAGVSGNMLLLSTTATGTSTNDPLTATAVTSSQYFTAGSSSFTATSSGPTFTPGQNGTLYDSGTINATLTGFSETPVVEAATFGQGSSPASIAASLAAAFHNDPYSPVDASAASGSATIVFMARAQGTNANSYSISIAEQSNSPSSFPTPSFISGSAKLGGGVTPTPSLDPTVVLSTTYSYDAMGDLLQSVQGQQTRTYQYDSLGRLTSSTIPETGYQAGTVSYTDFGAPSQIVDPRLLPNSSTHMTTTFAYDSLNRPQSVTYNDGSPGVTYSYNPPGSAHNSGNRLGSVTNGVATENYQYDSVGRVTLCAKTIGGQMYNTSYQYNTDGTLATITYPSGRTVTVGEDAIGRVNQIGTNGSMLLSIGSYNAAGEVLTETYGNGVAGTYTYNSQLQLASLQYGGSASILNLTYNYGGAQDNGQIQGITDSLASSRSTGYVYDELGRLKAAQTNDLTSANTWKLQFTYDRYGNRLQEIPVAGTANMPMNELLVDPTTNHVTSAGYGYDAAGNMISDGLYNYSYNAPGQMTSVTPVGALPLPSISAMMPAVSES